MTKTQDKRAEIAIGHNTPTYEWLEDSQVNRVKRAHLKLLGILPCRDLLVLDAGCGPGTYGIILAREGGTVAGIDISYHTVQVADRRARQKAARFLPTVGDLEALPFKESTFDVCFCGWTLHHFPDPEAIVAGLKRVLRPGGRIALVEPNESNLAMRLSRFVEDFPPMRKWILTAGWDTPNRTVHRHHAYIEALKRQGFVGISVRSSFPGSLPPLRMSSEDRETGRLAQRLITMLFWLRTLVFATAVRVLPPPLNGTDLLITASRGS